MTGDRIREAGWNSAQRLLRKGLVKKLWLASDADESFARSVREAAALAGVSPDRSKTGTQLAAMAGVEVFTAVLVEHENQ